MASDNNKKIWESILYGYTVDSKEPSFLSRGSQIFDTKDEDVISIFQNNKMTWKYDYSDSEHTLAQKRSASMKVSAHYGAFSAAASMSVSSSSDSSYKTVRMDAICRAVQYEVSVNNELATFPSHFLTDNFKKAVKELTVERFEESIGSFYVRKMDLGAELRKSYTMQATSTDTEQSVHAGLEMSFGSKLLGASASANVGVSTRVHNKRASMHVEWSAQGGDTTLWLGKSFSDDEIDDIQSEWAQSITPDNLYPFNYELGLMWELVSAVDAQKGKEFQDYLEAKWKKQANQFDPTKFITGKILYQYCIM